MRLKIFVFALIFLFSFAYVSAVIPADCASGIVSYWKFDGNYADSVGDNDGINNGLSTYDGVGDFKVIQSLAFGSEDDQAYLKINNDDSLKPSQFTIEGWFKPTDLLSIAYDEDTIILNKDGNYKVWVNASNKLKASVNGVVLDTGITVAVNQWVFFSLVWDSTTATFYMADSTNTFGSKVTQPVTGTLTGTSDLLLGMALTTDDYNFVGYMDELAFYNTALDSVTIKNHFDNSNIYGIGYCSLRTGVTSETTKNVQVAGCTIGANGEERLLIGDCSDSREWACVDDNEAWNTFTMDRACSFNLDLDSNANNQSFCCLFGYSCQLSDEDSNLICRPRLQDCSDFDDDEQACIDNQCYYFNGKCVEDISALSCSDYTNRGNCEEDQYNLGKEGSGTAVCGQYTDDGLLIPETSCYCFWNQSNRCELHYNSTKSRYGDDGPKLFQCFKYFNNSDCADGKQIVNWTVSYDLGSLTLTQSELTARLQNASCYNGTQEKQCGQAIVKVPGFGFINVIFVFFGLGVFYFISKRWYK